MIKVMPLKYIHANALCRIFNNKNVRKYLSNNIPNPYRHIDAIRYIHMSRGDENHIAMALRYKIFVVGTIAAVIKNNEADISYCINYKYWNKGIAKTSVSLFLNLLEAHSITCYKAEVYKGNYASRAVLEDNNFTFQNETDTS